MTLDMSTASSFELLKTKHSVDTDISSFENNQFKIIEILFQHEIMNVYIDFMNEH